MKRKLFIIILTIGSFWAIATPSSLLAVPSCPVRSCPSCPTTGCTGSPPGPNCICRAQRSCRCSSWCFGYVGGKCEAYESSCGNYQWECGAIATSPRPTRPARPAPTRGACNCHTMEVTGIASPGETLKFTASANVVSSWGTGVAIPSLSFTVLQNGTQVAQSGAIPAGRPVRTIDPQTGEVVNRYTAQYSYTIPAQGTGTVEYEILANYVCQQGSASRILPNDRHAEGFSIMQMEPPAWSTPMSQPGYDSLKLGTWKPKTSATIRNSCDRVEFQIQYL